jgi:hypothetical protein
MLHMLSRARHPPQVWPRAILTHLTSSSTAAARNALKGPTLNCPSQSLITVRNDYEWIGDPRAGEFVTYIDGRYAGSVILGETREFPVDPGTHTLRVRFR